MDEKSLCLHFERSHVERSSWARSEYEGRKRNGGKKDHYGSGDCSRDIVNSAVYAVHRGDSLVVFKFKDTRRSAACVPVPSRSVPVRLLVPRKAIISCAHAPRPADPCSVDLLAVYRGHRHRGGDCLIHGYRLPLTQDPRAHRIMGSSLILY
jgi:hypothetical protein